MSETLEAVKDLAAAGDVRISEHGYDELAEDRIAVRDIIGGLDDAVVVEDYPEFPRVRRCWCYNMTIRTHRSMSSGAYREGTPAQQCW